VGGVDEEKRGGVVYECANKQMFSDAGVLCEGGERAAGEGQTITASELPIGQSCETPKRKAAPGGGDWSRRADEHPEMECTTRG